MSPMGPPERTEEEVIEEAVKDVMKGRKKYELAKMLVINADFRDNLIKEARKKEDKIEELERERRKLERNLDFFEKMNQRTQESNTRLKGKIEGLEETRNELFGVIIDKF